MHRLNLYSKIKRILYICEHLHNETYASSNPLWSVCAASGKMRVCQFVRCVDMLQHLMTYWHRIAIATSLPVPERQHLLIASYSVTQRVCASYRYSLSIMSAVFNNSRYFMPSYRFSEDQKLLSVMLWSDGLKSVHWYFVGALLDLLWRHFIVLSPQTCTVLTPMRPVLLNMVRPHNPSSCSSIFMLPGKLTLFFCSISHRKVVFLRTHSCLDQSQFTCWGYITFCLLEHNNSLVMGRSFQFSYWNPGGGFLFANAVY